MGWGWLCTPWASSLGHGRPWLCPGCGCAAAFASGCSPVHAQLCCSVAAPVRPWLRRCPAASARHVGAGPWPSLSSCAAGLRRAAAIHRRFPRLQPHYLIKRIRSAAGGVQSGQGYGAAAGLWPGLVPAVRPGRPFLASGTSSRLSHGFRAWGCRERRASPGWGWCWDGRDRGSWPLHVGSSGCCWGSGHRAQ